MTPLLRPADVKKLLGWDIASRHVVANLGYCHLEFGTFLAYPEAYLIALRRAHENSVVRSQVIRFNKSSQGSRLYETICNEWAAKIEELAADCRRPGRPGWLMASDIAVLTGATSYSVGLWREQGRLAFERQGSLYYYPPAALIAGVEWKLPVE